MDRIQWIMSLIDRLSAPARRMEAATRAVRAAQEAAARQTGILGRAIAGLRAPVGIAMGVLRGFGSIASRVFSLPTAIAGGVIGAGIKSIIDSAGYKEQTLIAFTSMLGNAGKAANLYANAVAFAARTPFNDNQIIDATKSLLSYGFTTKQLEGILTSAGNLASGMGKPLEQVTTAFAALKGADFGQAFGTGQGFSQLGITRDLLMAKGLKFDKSGSYKGTVEAGMKAVQEIIKQRFGKGMDMQAKSIFGLVSTLQSKTGQLFGSLLSVNAKTGEFTGPLVPVRNLLENLANLTDFSKSPGSKIQTIFQRSVGGLFKAVFGSAADMTSGANGEKLVLGIIGWIDKATIWLRTEGPKVVQTVKQIFSGIAGAVGTILKIAKILAPFTPAIIAFFVAFKAVQAIIVAVQAIQLLIAAFGILRAALPLIGGPWGLLIAAIAAGVIYVITNWKKFQPAIQPIINWFGVAINKVKMFFLGLPVFFAGLWSRVSTIFSGAVAFLAKFPFLPIGAIAWLIQNFNSLPVFFSSLWANVTGIFNGAIAFLARFPVLPLGALAWLIQNWNTLPAAFSSIWATVQGVFNGAMAWFAGLPAQFAQFGANIILGIRDGILGALRQVKAAIEGAANSAIGWFKGALGIASPSKVFMGAGQEIGAGAAYGITKSLPMVSKAMRVLTATTALATGVMAKPVQSPVKKIDSPSRVVQTISNAGRSGTRVVENSKPVQATPRAVQTVNRVVEKTSPQAKPLQAIPKPVQVATRALEIGKTPKAVQTKPVQATRTPVIPQPVPVTTRVKPPVANTSNTSSGKTVNLTVKVEGSPSTDKTTLETYKALTVEALREVMELETLEVRGGN